VDPVSAGLLLAVVGGIGGAVGQQAWNGLSVLVRRPLRHSPLAETAPPSGVDELVMLQQAPTSREAATRLAGVLQVRAETDAEFRAALQGWLSEVRAVFPGGGDVHNQIRGGTQHGSVFQGRDFCGLAVSASPPPASDEGALGDRTPVPPALAEHIDRQTGGPMSDAAPSSALGIAELRECMWFLYDWTTTLLVHLRDHPNQALNRSIETPAAVAWPLLLAAPDADQLTRLEADLKTLRREFQRYHPAYLGSNPGILWGDEPVRLMEAGRQLVNAIHGMTVTFAGVTPLSDFGRSCLLIFLTGGGG
jgi:hypothetical protein